MDLLRAVKRRSLFSEAIYVLLNIALAVAVLAVVWAIESPLPAFALILLSKWRVLAVRPRFWFAHIQSNLVDLIVSVSLVVLLYAAGGNSGSGAIVQIILAVLYVLWLLVLKPRAKRSLVVLQAAVAVFVGTTALYTAAYEWPSSIVVLVMWVIGYAAARHVLAAYSESSVTFLSFIWGLLFAELGWLAYHWTIAYNLPLVEGIKLPQVTLVALSLSFLGERAYNSYERHGVVRATDILLPSLLSFGVIVLLMVAFNSVNSGTI